MFCIAVIAVVLGSVLTSTNVSDHDFEGLKSHVFQLEQTVSDLQSKSQVQEQKYATVLSSVLTKLTTTTDELAALRTEHNSTVLELESMKTKLEELHNKPCFQHKVTAFQARSQQETEYLTSDAVLIFGDVVTSTDNSYNSSSGVFTAPVNGTYFLYASILPFSDKPLAVMLKKGNDVVASSWTKEETAASLNTLIYLKEGESVKFITKGDQKAWTKLWSYIGGFLVAQL